MSRRNDTSDQSDSEATNKSNASETSNTRRRSASHKVNRDHGSEKIKLRLKLEKSEPITQAYKVDVSFVNSPTPRKPIPGILKSLNLLNIQLKKNCNLLFLVQFQEVG